MSDQFFKDVRAKVAFPVGSMGVIPVPPELSVKNYIESREHVYLYNPFAQGLSTRMVPLSSLTYRELSQAFIVEKANVREINSGGRESVERFQNLSKTSKIFWNVFVGATRRMLSTPKRDLDRKMEISPDMGLVISKPKRKIDKPKLTQRPGPPKPAGR